LFVDAWQTIKTYSSKFLLKIVAGEKHKKMKKRTKIIRISLIGILSLAIMVCSGGVAQAAITIGATTLVSTAALSLTAVDASTITIATAGAADDLTLSVTGANDSSLVLASEGTGADALTITTTAGGLDISVTGNLGGEDLNIDVAGANTEIRIDNTAGTEADAIRLVSSAGGIDIDANNSTLTISNNADGINDDFTIAQVGGQDASLLLTSAGTGADAIALTATAGDITIDTSTANKELKINTGTADVVITGTALSPSLTVAAGDIAVTDGSLTIVDGDDADTLTITNNGALANGMVALIGSGTYTGDAASAFLAVTPTGLTTGEAVYVGTDTITTGALLHLAQAGEVLAAGELLTIVNTENGDAVAKTGNLTSITSSITQTVSDKTQDYDTLLISRSDIMNQASKTLTAQGSVLKLLHTGTLTAGTAVTDTVITLEVEQADETTATGDLVQLTNVGVGAITLDVIAAGVGADDVQINASGAHTDGLAALHVKTTGNLATGGANLILTATGAASNSAARVLEIATAKDIIGIYASTAGVTEDAYYFTSTGATAATKGVLHVEAAGTAAADTSSVIKATYGGTATAESKVIEASASTLDVVGLYVNTHNTIAENSGSIVLYDSVDAVTGPSTVAYHESATPAADDQLFGIHAYGDDDGGTATRYAQITLEPEEVANTTEKGHIKMAVVDGDTTMRESFWLTDDTLALGEAAEFTLGSNGSQDLTISTAIDVAGINTNEPKIVMTDGASGNITITAGGTDGEIVLVSNVLRTVALVSAAGSTQADGTAITADINYNTDANGTTGVVLPTAVVGLDITIINQSGSTLKLYGAADAQQINGTGGNTAYSVVTVSGVRCIALQTTNWECEKSAR